jgi:MFS family permease
LHLITGPNALYRGLVRYLNRSPSRRLLLITAATAVGRGLPITISALYLTQIVGLPVRQVGAGLTVAAAVAVALSTWLGNVAHRSGARQAYTVFLVIEAISFLIFSRVGGFAAFIGAALALAIADIGARSTQGTVIVGIVPSEQRVRTRAIVRVVANIGIAAGGALGGVVLLRNDVIWYHAAFLAAAACLVAGAVLTLGLPSVSKADTTARGIGRGVFRDAPFLRFALLNGILNIHNAMLQVAIPLWITTRTDAPRWMVSVLLLVNVTSVVLLQVRLSRAADTLDGAIRIARLSGIALAAACVVLAVTDGTTDLVTVTLLVVVALTHAIGEILESASGWSVTFALAPSARTGQYQGAYAMSRGLGDLIGPVLLTSVAVTLGWAGWLVIAVTFLAAGVLTPFVLREARHPVSVGEGR